MERLNLEKAKLELKAKTNVERVNVKLNVKEIELEKERTTAGKADIPKLKINIQLPNLNSRKLMVTH